MSEADLHKLEDAARAAHEHAYSPYSGFAVGAAVLTDSGRMHGGCNVENASYGLSICAERNAVARMIAAGDTRIVAVAIYTPTSTATPPCGACRQVIGEFGPDARVVAICDGDDRLDTTMAELLPERFRGPASGGA